MNGCVSCDGRMIAERKTKMKGKNERMKNQPGTMRVERKITWTGWIRASGNQPECEEL